MAQTSGNRTRPNSIPALERASGRSWDDWLAVFEAAGGTSASHGELAAAAIAAMPSDLENPGWWAQGAAIAFEQHTGMRVPGQLSDGSFGVSASRTLETDRDAAIEAWAALVASAADQRGRAFGEPRTSRTGKRSFWRASLADAGKVEASATPKDEGRITFTVSQSGLADGAEIEAWRSHWKALLARM